MLATLINLVSLSQPKSLEFDVEPLTIKLQEAPMSHLLLIPRVGVKTAHKIMTYRKNNHVDSASDLLNVKGIGPATIDAMMPLLEDEYK